MTPAPPRYATVLMTVKHPPENMVSAARRIASNNLVVPFMTVTSFVSVYPCMGVGDGSLVSLNIKYMKADEKSSPAISSEIFSVKSTPAPLA
jgi:hypothetical protein